MWVHILIYWLIIDNEINLIDDLILKKNFDRPLWQNMHKHVYVYMYIICIYVHIGGIYVSAIFSPCEFLVICACLIKRNVFLDSSSKVRLLASLSTNNNFGSNHKKVIKRIRRSLIVIFSHVNKNGRLK